MKKTLIIILLFFSIVNILKAKDDFYIYGSLGISDFGLTTDDLNTLNTSIVNLGYSSSFTTTTNAGISLKLSAGFDINEFLAIEGGYTYLGELDLENTTTGPVTKNTFSFGTDGWEISGLGKFGDDDQYFFARGGFWSWNVDVTVTTSLGSSTAVLGSGTDALFGVGGDYSGIRAEVTAYGLDGDYVYNYSVGYKYSF